MTMPEEFTVPQVASYLKVSEETVQLRHVLLHCGGGCT